MTKFVYAFTEGNKDMKDLLGGKGANLAEMTQLGLPVPPGIHDQHGCLPLLPGERRNPGQPRCRGHLSAARSRAADG